MAAQGPAPRAVDAVQHPAATGRAFSRVPDQQLDRARCLAIHRPRAHRAARAVLHAPAPGGAAQGPVGAGDRADPGARRRADRNAPGALSHRGRHQLHLPGGNQGRHGRRHRARNPGRRHERTRRHPHGRPDQRGVDGKAQKGRVFLMSIIDLISADGDRSRTSGHDVPPSALKFITCGSVDDGKSTLIGRLLLDSRAVLQDHLAGVQRGGQTDLALLTDGLSAEREQGITIDVAYRYFATEERKFIIGDAPGHEQYTRNMVTAASSADAAVVLVDASKLDWQNPQLALLPQPRRHALLAHLLRVHSLVFAVNKLDAVADPALAYRHIQGALARFAQAAGMDMGAAVPLSALEGWNVVDAHPGWCGYAGPTLLQVLEALPNTPADTGLPLSLPVQWVEKNPASSDISRGRRIFWGRVATGSVAPGSAVQIFPSGQWAGGAQVLDDARGPGPAPAGSSAGIILDRELDVSRGDWILATPMSVAPAPSAPATPVSATAATDPACAPAWLPRRELRTTVAWLDDQPPPPPPPPPAGPPRRDLRTGVAWLDAEPLVAGRVYWALHGHRWVKAKVRAVLHKLDIDTLAEEPATQLGPNAIGHVDLQLQEALPTMPFQQARVPGSLILVDSASHKTAGAVLVN